VVEDLWIMAILDQDKGTASNFAQMREVGVMAEPSFVRHVATCWSGEEGGVPPRSLEIGVIGVSYVVW
jgi:hypothetical protein